ncbi:hypothetical protein ASPWEDRAFT_168717 [Aspergillus wentii DTO 134E9]|uniref:Proteinase inhibitor I78 n=1 Tax=Aspergillus wentii DTO 134E9 TaxID=1073089 RepID=A0A1L9RV71_ASPWE|nr:uncharacterized protein ASPWEDRAFT_168717 [Aspergillus wentii DTO 134E9]KAI9928746.1 hypothetical protein MW887_001964 [Aspergillus wentii]OJJ38841.1 hypothetical protein ASPWEDRAFT_168717 [Aspergillus wentii DTO 134E9]
MPLVVPGIQNTTGGDKNEWLNKLVGKKITESTHDVESFAKTDLPKSHRILRPGSPMTFDYRVERLNIHLNEQDRVQDVSFG